MDLLRKRSVVVASLLLAAVAFTAVVAESHGHEALGLSGAHGDLPSFSAGHEHPDRTVHIEGATRLEVESCVGCLQRQRQGADGPQKPALTDIQPSSTILAEASFGPPASDARRLPASRAPPRA